MTTYEIGVDGLWSAEFLANTGVAGTGVVFFTNGQIYGGDDNYYYSGTYQQQGRSVRANIKVKHYRGPRNNVFGPVEYVDLVLEVAVGDPWAMGQGYDPRLPSRKISVKLLRLEKAR